jgi:hypothetical protein
MMHSESSIKHEDIRAFLGMELLAVSLDVITRDVERHGTEPTICKWICSMLESRNISTTSRLCLPPTFMLVSCSAYFLTLKMEVICFSEMPVNFQLTTCSYIPEVILLITTMFSHGDYYTRTLQSYLIENSLKLSEVL